jgi:hypothetical protein
MRRTTNNLLAAILMTLCGLGAYAWGEGWAMARSGVSVERYGIIGAAMGGAWAVYALYDVYRERRAGKNLRRS